MLTKKLGLMIACSMLSVIARIPANAQAPSALSPTANVVVTSRVVEAVDDRRRATLQGNTPPMARRQFEAGRVEASLPMQRMVLVLQRSAEQDAALAAFNARQYDPKSADFHHWLHAEEFGRAYGPSDADMAAVTGWLQHQGFQVEGVSKGRTTIQFSGTAAQVESAFQLEMHHYAVNGEAHIANDRDPSIPEALAPVVRGIASLHDFFGKPQHVLGKYVSIDPHTGKKTLTVPQPVGTENAGSANALETRMQAESTQGPKPQFTYIDNSGDTREDLTPYDVATIYNILPLWTTSTPINGTGVKIAISGTSDISQTDVSSYRTTFGLPAMTLQTIHNGVDPGADSGDGQSENSLDVEMAGATAPGAQIILVSSKYTATTSGDLLSDQYIVDNETAPIMSASYGECELMLGTAGNAAYNSVWQQGATEGISIFESSGDEGSAGCTANGGSAPYADDKGLQVNGMASSPYVTAVGGTDFTWSFIVGGTAATYWNATNGTQLQTAKGILPEVPWNSTCTNPLLVPYFTGESSPEQVCNDASISGSYDGLVSIQAGSGGVSQCTQPTGTTPGTCAGGYAKPSWQTGFGSSTTQRDLPDVSLFAASSWPDQINGSALLFCASVRGATCTYSSVSGIMEQEIGGTSASSPLWAGIMALIVQKTGASQGLANPALYKLYANQVTAGTACNSSTVTNGNSCVFYDVTQGTNAQVCFTGDPNCVTNTTGDQLGILSGYSAAAGYDDATGLGTVNVTNLVNSWASVTTAATLTVSLSPTTLTFASTTLGSTSAAQTVTITNSGTGTVTLTSETLTGTDASSYLISANTCGGSLAAGASCAVSVEFKPAGTGTLTASLSLADNATGSPQTVALTGTGAAAALTVSVAPTTLTFGSATQGSTSAAQVVTVTNSGTGAVTLTSETLGGTNASSYLISANTCGGSLAVGASCAVSVEFKPAGTGALTATLSVADNATGSPQTVALTGTGAAAAVTVSVAPTTLTFGSTTQGSTSAAQVVTITNSGTGAVTLTSETLGGTNASSYLISANTCGGSLAAGASCAVSVEFKPAGTGTLTANLLVADNATGSPQTVALTGTGAAVVTAPAVTLSSTSLSFGSSPIGTGVPTQQVTVTNSGTGALTITGISVMGANSASFTETNTCGSSLSAGAQCALTVTFDPTASGSLSASVTLSDNASGSPQTIALTGTGTPTVPASYTLSGSAVTLSPGAEGYSTVTATGSAGYTGTITLNSCTVTTVPKGAIDLPACYLTGPLIVIAAGGTTATTPVDIRTTGPKAALEKAELNERQTGKRWKETGEVALAGLMLFGMRRRKLSMKALLSLVLLFAMLGVLAGCGAGTSPTPMGGTTAGSYVLTVTGTDGAGEKQTTTINLTIS